MAIDFNFTKAASSTPAKADRPKANFWLNVGYEVDVIVDDKPETRFISLPMGMPVDTMEKLSTKSSNTEFRALQSARNNLLDMLMAEANKMKPGETHIVNLKVEVRRVNDEQEAIPSDVNPFIKALTL